MKPYIVLVIVVLLSVVPFAHRAVSLDEHLFLKLAQNALANPLFPSDTPGLFFGLEVANFGGHTHPPVGEYFLAGLYTVFGEFSEAPFRIAYSVFAIAAVLTFYALARMFTTEPLLVAMLFAVTPAFFVNAPTLMMDVPMLAFLLAGFLFYFWKRLAPAAACFILATGVGYSALVPIGCLFIVLVLGRRPLKEILCVLSAPVALLFWLAAMTVHYGEFPLVQSVHVLRQSPLRTLLATLPFLGGVCVCPGIIRLKRKPLLVAMLAAAVISTVAPLPTVWARVWFAVLATCGLALLGAFVRSTMTLISSDKNRGEAVFILWAPAVLVFFITVGEFMSARYLLLALPALYLVVFRQWARRQLIPAIGATAALSIALAYADLQLVNSYREWTAATVPPLQQQGFRVWNAAESGLRFYVERTGAGSLSSTDLRPIGTDLIVQHDGEFVPYRYALAPDLGIILTTLKTFTIASRFPLRTYNKTAGAGFHDSGAGLLPFMFSRAPLDRIDVSQVSPLVERLPQESTDAERVPVWSPSGPILKESQAERVFQIKLPRNIQIQYELEGTGRVETTDQGVRLINTSGATIVWHRFRIVPQQFMEK